MEKDHFVEKRNGKTYYSGRTGLDNDGNYLRKSFIYRR